MSEEQATHHTLVTSFWMLNFCSFSVLNTSGNVMYIRKKPTLLSFGREEHMRCMCVCIYTSVHAQICIYIQSSNTDICSQGTCTGTCYAFPDIFSSHKTQLLNKGSWGSIGREASLRAMEHIGCLRNNTLGGFPSLHITLASEVSSRQQTCSILHRFPLICLGWADPAGNRTLLQILIQASGHGQGSLYVKSAEEPLRRFSSAGEVAASLPRLGGRNPGATSGPLEEMTPWRYLPGFSFLMLPPALPLM